MVNQPADALNPVVADKKVAKPKPETADLFVLDSVFPDPLAYLATFAPSTSELAKDCAFALDANALIALYKLPVQSIREITGPLTALKDEGRLFVPKRALQECLKNRSIVLREQFQSVVLLEAQNATPRLPPIPMLEGHPEYDSVSLLMEPVAKARSELAAAVTKLKESLRNWAWNDPVSAMLASILTPDCIVEPALTNEEIAADAHHRMRLNIPPGYKDKAKDDIGIGDVIIWHTLIALAAKTNRHVIFASNDEKPDWTVSESKSSLLPRSELCSEFYAKTGRHFSILPLSKMMELLKADREAINRIRRVEQDSTQDVTSGFDHGLADICSHLEQLFATAADIQLSLTTTGQPNLALLCAEFIALRQRYRAKYDALTKAHPEVIGMLHRTRVTSNHLAGCINGMFDPMSAQTTGLTQDGKDRLDSAISAFFSALVELQGLVR